MHFIKLCLLLLLCAWVQGPSTRALETLPVATFSIEDGHPSQLLSMASSTSVAGRTWKSSTSLCQDLNLLDHAQILCKLLQLHNIPILQLFCPLCLLLHYVLFTPHPLHILSFLDITRLTPTHRKGSNSSQKFCHFLG